MIAQIASRTLACPGVRCGVVVDVWFDIQTACKTGSAAIGGPRTEPKTLARNSTRKSLAQDFGRKPTVFVRFPAIPRSSSGTAAAIPHVSPFRTGRVPLASDCTGYTRNSVGQAFDASLCKGRASRNSCQHAAPPYSCYCHANLCSHARVMPCMDTKLLDNKFVRMGARLKFAERPTSHASMALGSVTLDVQADRHGEYFQILKHPMTAATVEVLDVQPADRHLLLLVRQPGEKLKFLCGHDERHWFVAAIPEAAPVGTVQQAKEALKPVEVQVAQNRQGVSGRQRSRRKNAAYVRQGEWFFLPESLLMVDKNLILRNEPLSRGNGSKPHWVDFCYRTGGETVYVCSRHPNGVSEQTYQQLLAKNPRVKTWNWRTMRRNPGVYVQGRIRHADHNTIVLHGWHRVLMNTENQARSMQHVAFLD